MPKKPTPDEVAETIREALLEDIEGTIDLRFGGSIQKYTYVDGLSDIDCLVLLKDPELESLSPKDVLDYFRSKLEDRLKNAEAISIGKLAATIRYKDGTAIQLLPAIRKGAGYVISTAGGERWSSIIRPRKFAEALTKVGLLGIKIWICKGEIFGKRDLSPNIGVKSSKPKGNLKKRRK